MAHAQLEAVQRAFPRDMEVSAALGDVLRSLGQHGAAAQALLHACKCQSHPQLLPWLALPLDD